MGHPSYEAIASAGRNSLALLVLCFNAFVSPCGIDARSDSTTEIPPDGSL